MRVLTLAAGTGSRLKPLTENNPKCLVKLDGKSLLDYQIDAFEKNGINDLSIVVGYKKEAFKVYENRISNFYSNDNYLNNNMVSSLMFGESLFEDDLIVSYSDIVFSPDIVSKLKESTGDFQVVVDLNWLDLWKNREENPLDDAESLVLDDKNNILNIGQKAKNLEEIEGQYIGLMKFSKEGLTKIKKLYEIGKQQINSGELAWGRVKNLDKAYFTDLLMALIESGESVKALKIEGNWFEVDTYDDYKLYDNDIKENGFSYNIGRS